MPMVPKYSNCGVGWGAAQLTYPGSPPWPPRGLSPGRLLSPPPHLPLHCSPCLALPALCLCPARPSGSLSAASLKPSRIAPQFPSDCSPPKVRCHLMIASSCLSQPGHPRGQRDPYSTRCSSINVSIGRHTATDRWSPSPYLLPISRVGVARIFILGFGHTGLAVL